MQLLTEVCAVDRAEIIAENDLAGMSVKEIKELVEKSKQQGEQLALLGDELNDSNNAQKSLQADKQNLVEENKLLHKRIKELESKPVEVAVQSPSEEEINRSGKENCRACRKAEKSAGGKRKIKSEQKAAVKRLRKRL